MKLNSLAAIATIASLIGATALAPNAQACIYSQLNSAPDLTAPTSPPANSATQANFNSLNTFGIAGAGLAILGGLFGGGMLLKARLKRVAESDQEQDQMPQIEELPEPFESSKFAIEIPPEVARSLSETNLGETNLGETKATKGSISTR